MKLPYQLNEIWGLCAIATLSVALTVGQGIQRPADEPMSRAVPVRDAADIDPSTTVQAPDFSAYRDIDRRKVAFYDYLLPKIREANREVMQQRQWLLGVASQLVGGQSLTNGQMERIAVLERRYGVMPQGELVTQVGNLLRRVDVVPASLVLAQAAKESGWGTSRFAIEGNNYFGIWCFNDGCGITPERRDVGRTHEVAMFDSVADGVRFYIRTLNSQPAYSALRAIRAKARRDHQALSGDQLAEGLTRYSARGVTYVKEIRSMIEYNNLHRFTIPHQEA